eukprot:2665-Pelagomonas_calceolata.AAC.1
MGYQDTVMAASLSQPDIMHNVSQFRLRAHTLNVETAFWEDGCPPLCNWCSCRQSKDAVHVLFKCWHEGHVL